MTERSHPKGDGVEQDKAKARELLEQAYKAGRQSSGKSAEGGRDAELRALTIREARYWTPKPRKCKLRGPCGVNL